MEDSISAAELRRRIAELEGRVAERDAQIASLTEQQIMLQALIDQIPDLLYAKDLDLRFVFGNRSVAASFGLNEAHKIIGMCDSDVFSPELAADYGAVERWVIDSGEPLRDIEQMTFDEQGQERWVLTTKIPWRDREGVITGIIGIARDITERRAAEQQLSRQNEELEQIISARTGELAASEALFRALFDRAPLGIGITEDGRFVQVNPAYLSMFGHSDASGLIGTPLIDQVAPSARAEMQERMAQRQRGEVDQARYTTRVLCGDGSELPVLAEVARFEASDGRQRYVTFLSDLTELQRAEGERAALSAQIIEAQQAALRELSTPLVPIADEVVAMPLVGSIDGRRAQQIMESLLEGIVAQQAAYAIIDVTGVRLLDTYAAGELMRVAQAAKLLGAQVILTGVSAEVAQTLVHMGADMGGIVTRSNLQAGITYAIQSPGA